MTISTQIKNTITLAILSSIAGPVSTAHAALIAYDGFVAGTDQSSGEYTDVADGNYRLQSGQNPTITGFSGSWQNNGGTFRMGTTPPSSLSYTDSDGSSLSTSGNSIFRGGPGISYRSFDSNLINFAVDQTYYMSFLLQVTDVNKQARIVLGKDHQDWRDPAIRIDSTGFSLRENGTSTQIATTDTDTHLAIFKINVNSTGTGHNLELFWDPILSSEGANVATDAGFDASIPTNILLSSKNTSGAINFDELRIGTSWDSVTTASGTSGTITQEAYDAVVAEKEAAEAAQAIAEANEAAAIASLNALPTLSQLQSTLVDLRPGSTMIAVSGGSATVSLQLEESSDLSSWSDSGAAVPFNITLDQSDDTQFFRVKLAE